MRDIALTLFILGMIPYILMRPFLGLLVWSWLGYMNPHRLCWGFAANFPWVTLVAITTFVSLAISKENKRIVISSVSVLLFAFVVWTGITTLFAVAPSARNEWWEFAKILIMAFVTLMLVRDRERMHWLVWMIVVSLGFYGLKGGIFTILGGGANHVFGPPHSFIADNNAFALAMCMVLPFMRYLQLQASQKWVRAGLGIGMLLTGVAVLGTYSRGGLLGLAIVGGMLFLKTRKRLAMIVAILVVAFTAYQFMPPQWTARMDTLHHAAKTDSGETRIQSWEFAANVALHRPVVGGGFNDYQSSWLWQAYAPAESVQRAIHSIYFRVLSEQGFPGLILFLGLLFVSWRNCSRVRKKTRDSPELHWAYDLASMLQVTLTAYAVCGAFLPMTYFDLVYQLMALSAVLAAYCVQQVQLREPAIPSGFAVSHVGGKTPKAV